MMGVNSLPKTVTQQRRSCDLNPGFSVPEYSTLTTRLPSRPTAKAARKSWNHDHCEYRDFGHAVIFWPSSRFCIKAVIIGGLCTKSAQCSCSDDILALQLMAALNAKA